MFFLPSFNICSGDIYWSIFSLFSTTSLIPDVSNTETKLPTCFVCLFLLKVKLSFNIYTFTFFCPLRLLIQYIFFLLSMQKSTKEMQLLLFYTGKPIYTQGNTSTPINFKTEWIRRLFIPLSVGSAVSQPSRSVKQDQKCRSFAGASLIQKERVTGWWSYEVKVLSCTSCNWKEERQREGGRKWGRLAGQIRNGSTHNYTVRPVTQFQVSPRCMKTLLRVVMVVVIIVWDWSMYNVISSHPLLSSCFHLLFISFL